jgi:cohesin complex subunit SA-1/2
MWDLVTIEDMIAGAGGVATPHAVTEIENLRQRFRSYMDVALALIQSGSQQEFKEEAFLCVCDLLIIFGDQLGRNNPALAPLVYSPDRNLQTLLNEFIQAYIFVEDDDCESHITQRAMDYRRKKTKKS